jgi:ectoine hydroxylase-related dioxygenase (phytanoyl-CoA dioxygenase family)
MFFKGGCQKIHLAVKEYNSFNSNSWWFSVETGDIVLFPSSLTHMVETKKGDNTRVSLSFNVFIKGTLGSNKNLTELTL